MTARPPRALAALLFAAALPACGDDDPGPRLEAGEELPGGETTNTFLLGQNAFIRPAENLADAHEQAFYSGNSLFNMPWVEAPASTTRRDGLGPLYNARSCAACHFRDGRGAPPEGDEAFLGLLVRLSVPGVDRFGGPLPDPSYGGQLQPFALPGVPVEANPRVSYTVIEGAYADGAPYTLHDPVYTFEDLAYGPFADDLMTSPRVAPPTIGLGLLEAIPDSRLMALEDPDDADGDGISGRLNHVWDVEAGALRVGRFGWKGDQPSVRQQVAGALLGDMGITSPVFGEKDCAAPQADCLAAMDGGAIGDDGTEPEIEAADFDKLVLYSEVLAVPARRSPGSAEVLRGKALFHDAGCAGCHVPSHVTGPHHLGELSGQLIWPYTDLLLHDMGEALSDHRPVFAAEGAEWRTPPLWGIGLYQVVNGHTRLLHDGRARGVAEAILWHGGEGEAAREAFRAMTAADRAALVIAAATLSSCVEGDVRTRIVEAWADTVIVPGYGAFATDAHALAESAAEQCQGGLEHAGLVVVRNRWDAARGRWKAMEVFAFGPYEDYPARLGPNTDFWPARPEIIEAVLDADDPLTAASVAGKGAAARGLPVIEYLLWGEGDDLDAWQSGRRCDYLVAATADLDALAGTMRATWQGYVPVLTGAADGPFPAPQDGFGEVLNRMGFTVENIRRDKLGRPLGLVSGSPQPGKVESPYADRSVRDARDALVTLGLLYEGVGDGLSLRRHPRLTERADLDRAFRGALNRSLAALDRISGPLDEAIYTDPAAVQAAIDALGELQTVIQVDLIGALAVSRAFNDSDGD